MWHTVFIKNEDFKNYSKTRIFRKVGNKKSVVKVSSKKGKKKNKPEQLNF